MGIILNSAAKKIWGIIFPHSRINLPTSFRSRWPVSKIPIDDEIEESLESARDQKSHKITSADKRNCKSKQMRYLEYICFETSHGYKFSLRKDEISFHIYALVLQDGIYCMQYRDRWSIFAGKLWFGMLCNAKVKDQCYTVILFYQRLGGSGN